MNTTISSTNGTVPNGAIGALELSKDSSSETSEFSDRLLQQFFTKLNEFSEDGVGLSSDQLQTLENNLQMLKSFLATNPEASLEDAMSWIRNNAQAINDNLVTDESNSWAAQILELTELSQQALGLSSQNTKTTRAAEQQAIGKPVLLSIEQDALADQTVYTSTLLEQDIHTKDALATHNIAQSAGINKRVVSNQSWTDVTKMGINQTNPTTTEIIFNNFVKNNLNYETNHPISEKIVTVESEHDAALPDDSTETAILTGGQVDSLVDKAMPTSRAVYPFGATSLNVSVLTNRLNESIQWMIGKRLSEAEIKVTPKDLGPITINLSLERNQAIISFGSNQELTRIAIEDSMDKLKDALANQGINIEQSFVGTEEQSSGFKQFMHDQSKQKSNPQTTTDEQTSQTQDIGKTSPANHDGLLNIYA